MDNIIVKEVNNRALVLALDYMYREHMKIFEVEKLLPASTYLMDVLSMSVPDIPIEGYYNESEELKTYFLNMRALQNISLYEREKADSLKEYKILANVMSSEIYGAGRSEGFFPRRLDPLYYALMDMNPGQWTTDSLTLKAYQISNENDDISLVGLAAFLKDAVVLAALRETVVLYAALAAGCAMEQPTIEYVWNVDKTLQAKVNRFITVFNELALNNIPEAKAENVECFYNAFEDNAILGRCVFIGYDDSKQPVENYHWAIKHHGSDLVVDDFWSTELWTTERYHEEKLYP